jgi:hypothetical protein
MLGSSGLVKQLSHGVNGSYTVVRRFWGVLAAAWYSIYVKPVCEICTTPPVWRALTTLTNNNTTNNAAIPKTPRHRRYYGASSLTLVVTEYFQRSTPQNHTEQLKRPQQIILSRDHFV